MRATLFILGPGGVGKSNLEKLFSDDVLRINPYRLRRDGPRPEMKNQITNEIEKDDFFAPLKLKEEIELIAEQFGDSKQILSEDVFWYPRCKILIFNVRGTWQVLPLIRESIAGENSLAKAEIYATVLPQLFSNKDFSFLGEIVVIILNPSSKSILETKDLRELKEATKENLIRRKRDSDLSIMKRVGSINEEFNVWKNLLKTDKAACKVIEFPGWEFPEYLYALSEADDVLKSAKKCLLNKMPELQEFFTI